MSIRDRQECNEPDGLRNRQGEFAKAPKCTGTTSGRHKWRGDDNKVSRYIRHESCFGCNVKRVHEYTKNGNHVRGYVVEVPHAE